MPDAGGGEPSDAANPLDAEWVVADSSQVAVTAQSNPTSHGVVQIGARYGAWTLDTVQAPQHKTADNNLALSQQRDHPVADADHGQRVGAQEAPEHAAAGALWHPRDEALAEQGVAVAQECREEVERRELVDRRRGGLLRSPVGTALRSGEQLDVAPRRAGQLVGVAVLAA